MLFQGAVQALFGALKSTGNPNVSQGFSAELINSKAYPDLYYLAKNNKLFYQVATAISPTVFVGGAAGTPAIGLYNPTGSGVDAIIVATRIAVRTTGTAAVTWDLSWYGGPSANITGTTTANINAYSQVASGSAIKGFVNTALTGSTAVTLTAPVLSGGLTAATAVTNVTNSIDYTFGALVCSPGNLQAIGQGGGALTAAVFGFAVYWAELTV